MLAVNKRGIANSENDSNFLGTIYVTVFLKHMIFKVLQGSVAKLFRRIEKLFKKAPNKFYQKLWSVVE